MEIIFYLFLFIFGVILAVFLLTVFFGAPYVPTHKKELIKLFEKLKLSKNDILADIGSGDGVVLKTASNFSAKSIGFEINPFLVLISRIRLRNSKIHKFIFEISGTSSLSKKSPFSTLLATLKESKKC
jgi:hypothetical protein cdivTM_09943